MTPAWEGLEGHVGGKRPNPMRPESIMPGTGIPALSGLSDLAFTGGCEVQLERAVLPYRSVEDRALPGGRSADLGVGVVIQGPARGRMEVVDLGSGSIREADVGLPVVIYGWLFTTPFRELERWARARAAGRPSGDGVPGAPGVARRILSNIGYSPLTRSLFLRAGFRDVALDLDPHEGTAVRLALPGAGVARVHMEYDHGALVFRTGRSEPVPVLLQALSDAFPHHPLFRVVSGAGQGTSELHVHLPDLPSLGEVKDELRRIRRGLLHLLARFDEERHRAVTEAMAGFGERDLLAGVPDGVSATEAHRRGGTAVEVDRERILLPRGVSGPGRIH